MDGIWKVCPEAGGPVQFPGFNGMVPPNTSALLIVELDYLFIF